MKKIATTLSFCAATTLLQAGTTDNLATVTIASATKSEQSIQDVTSNVEVITGHELKEQKINTVTQALRMKGIPVAQSGGTGQQTSFFLRGFRAGNSVVLIDGVRYNDPTDPSGAAHIQHLLISDIERIEIIKGAQSGIWGADAVAGVINIITKQPSEELKVNATIEYGSNSSELYKMSVSQKVGDFSYYLGASFLKTDGISAMTPKGENPKNYERDGYENTTLNAKVVYDISDRDTVSFGVTDIYAKDEYDVGSPNDTSSKARNRYRTYDTQYKHYFGSGNIALNYQRTDLERVHQTWKAKGSIDKYSIQSQIDYLENSFIIMGADTTKSKDKENSHDITNTGYFVTNSNRFENIILTQSLRHDEFNRFSDKTTGKVGAKYLFSDDIDISVNYGTAYKAPTFSQLYGWGGDENLKPESTKGYDITARYKGLSVTYYENKTKDMILSDQFWQLYQSSGKSKFKGYEVRFVDEVYRDLIVGVSYDRLFATDKDGNDLPRRARSSVGVSVDYYGLAKTHLGLYANYTGTRYNELAQTNQTGRYTLIDSVINYDINQNFSTYFKAENITDKRYQEVHNYGTYGRTFRVGLHATF